MSLISAWFAWANVPFVATLGIAVGFALLQATGLLGLLAGGDHEADADGDADTDADGDADGHDSDSDNDHDSDQGGSDFSISGLLGVGRAPLTFLLQCMLTCFAITGLSINMLTYGLTVAPLKSLLWTLPISLTVSWICTGLIARLAGRVFSSDGQNATARGQLIGATGVVISSRIDKEFGEVRIKDLLGQTVRVVCTTHDEKPIVEGTEIVVVDYDQDRDKLVVAMLEDTSQRPKMRAR